MFCLELREKMKWHLNPGKKNKVGQQSVKTNNYNMYIVHCTTFVDTNYNYQGCTFMLKCQILTTMLHWKVIKGSIIDNQT